MRAEAQPLARAHTTRGRAISLTAGLTLITGLLGGCVTADPPVNTSEVTAGGGTCKLPNVTVDPTSFEPGDSVTLKGQWFVEGCGGNPGLTPRTVIAAVLTDAAGVNFPFDPIDAQTDQGTFEVKVQIPEKAAAGAGRVIVGQAGPVPVMVED